MNAHNIKPWLALGSSPTLSACSDPAAAVRIAADGSVLVPARHPDVFRMGRFDCSEPGALGFAYPAVALRVRFEGTELDLRLQDAGTGGADGTNYYDLIVDGKLERVLEVSAAVEVYPLFRAAQPGVHEVEVVKRTESNWGKGAARLLGLRLNAGSKLLPALGRPRRLEFIGDSITCGYGNELAVADPTEYHFTTRNENARLAYGALTAQALGADYALIAASGRGVSRNWQGGPGRLAPEYHRLALPDAEPAAAWDFAQFQPHAAIVNLGTNDFSPGGVERAAFRRAYVEFLAHLRSVYPNTWIVVALGPMLSDAFPPGEHALTNIRADLRAILDARKAAGDSAIELFELGAQRPPFGEDWHPSLATHARLAERLTAHLRERLGW